jgi:glucose dehydrogenase
MRFFLTATFVAVVLPAQVPYTRIVNANKEPQNWLTYSRTYDGQRYSPLAQITPANVARLNTLWTYQIEQMDHFETTPIVADGILYLTEPPDAVSAVDARSGRRLWRYVRPVPADIQVCCGRVNRGVAILDNTVYVGTLDAHLLALNARNGALQWDIPVADYKSGHSLTGAPLAIDGKVVVGIAGGEYGIRGFIDAYDAKSGKQLWRFWTVPGSITVSMSLTVVSIPPANLAIRHIVSKLCSRCRGYHVAIFCDSCHNRGSQTPRSWRRCYRRRVAPGGSAAFSKVPTLKVQGQEGSRLPTKGGVTMLDICHNFARQGFVCSG